MTLIINQPYVIAASDTLDFVDQNGIVMQDELLQPPPTLLNYGTIRVEGSGSRWVTGVIRSVSYSTDGDFVNAAGARLLVRSTGDNAIASGFIASGGSLYNQGQIRVVSDGLAQGVSGNSTADFIIENTGRLNVAGGDGSFGARVDYRGVVINTGSIHVAAIDGHATGVMLYLGPTINNEGVIRVDDHTAARDSTAVLYGRLEGAQLLMSNSGLIRADYAFRQTDFVTPRQESGETLLNSGRIFGAVALGAGDDQIFNTGSVVGAILLGTGADRFEGHGGRVIGQIHGGGGDDVLSAGKGSGLVFGDAGDDLLNATRPGQVLNGGEGSDAFAFARPHLSPPGAPVLIADLEAADRIDLSAIDAGKHIAGHQPLTQVAAFDGGQGEFLLAYDAGSDRTSLEVDLNGDSIADMVVLIAGDQTAFTGFTL